MTGVVPGCVEEFGVQLLGFRLNVQVVVAPEVTLGPITPANLAKQIPGMAMCAAKRAGHYLVIILGELVSARRHVGARTNCTARSGGPNVLVHVHMRGVLTCNFHAHPLVRPSRGQTHHLGCRHEKRLVIGSDGPL